MNIHKQFTFYHFLITSIILLVINVLILKFNKKSLNELLNWKVFLFSIILTLLGLFYTEMRTSGMGDLKTYGFPRDFIENWKEFTEDFGFARLRFKFFNFFQNITIYFLFINLFFNVLKKRNEI